MTRNIAKVIVTSPVGSCLSSASDDSPNAALRQIDEQMTVLKFFIAAVLVQITFDSSRQ